MTTISHETLVDVAREVRIASQALTRRLKDNTLSLPPHLFTVLVWLESGPSTAAELAARERVSPPSMSKTIKELEDRGLLAREPDPTDARSKIVTLTRAGRRAILKGREERDHWMADRMAELSPAEQALLRDAAAVLRRVVEHR
jgi:DNA-binding MarR family transcriptional regulator